MAGASTVAAPSAARRATSSPACARARVTTTRRPSSGRFSNQARSQAATSPTTMVEGEPKGASPMVASVARTVRCSGRVPHCVAATGVSGARPPAISASAIRPIRATPMRMTMVPPTRATASQSTVPSSPAPGSSWPVTMVTLVDEWRSVTGMPA